MTWGWVHNFPASKDTFTKPIDYPDVGYDRIIADWWKDIFDAVEAIQEALGYDITGAFDTTKAWLDDIETKIVAKGFTDRGDPVNYDRTVGDFNTDNTWRDWDLSAIVPAGAKVVAIHMNLTDNVVGSRFAFRRNGNAQIRNAARVRTIVANVTNEVDIIVACDEDRIIEYRGEDVDFLAINVTIKGWWK